MITINWKTYKQLHNKYSIEWLVKHGYMEEVKEKPLSQKRAEAIERGKEITILEKLREWVDKELKLDGYEHQQILDKIDLLTSLETSPISKTETTQFTPWQEEKEAICEANMPEDSASRNSGDNETYAMDEWTPTPWQEIEVSDDWIDWVHSKFVDMYEGKYRVNNTSEDFPSMRTYWNNARPIKIEPELPSVPKFEWLEIIEDCAEKSSGKEWEYDKYLIDALGDQLEILTTFCKALARQKTTK